jgi:branched-chain amino acid transport system ATP-binding protein
VREACERNRLLAVRGLRAGYGRAEVLRGVDLHVDAGEVVVLLGANGAGKTTTLLALAGVLPCRGTVELFGSTGKRSLCRRARGGLAFLPEDRGIVRGLTVGENLRLARVAPQAAYRISPELEPLAGRLAGRLSGGEQQILALTRAICGRPALLLADEVSFGLAPLVAGRMLRLARLAADRGAGVVLVEQYARQALATADRGYVLQRGSIVLTGSAAELARNIDAIERSYLG